MNRVKKNNLIKAGVVLGTVFLINAGWAHYSDCQQENFKKAIDNQQEVLYNKDIEIKELNNVVMNQGEEITTLTAELETLKEAKVAEASSKPNSNYRTITVKTTAYTAGDGDTPSTTMANGQEVYVGAVAYNGVPLGTKIEINGNMYTVCDRVGSDGVVDIYMNSYNEAVQYGVQYKEIKIYD